MTVRFPMQVAIMDDDFYALKWNTALIMRDPRTTVVAEAEYPRELINLVKTANNNSSPDMYLLDVEYHKDRLVLSDFLNQLKALSPDARIICFSQYAETEQFHCAIEHHVDGFLMKNDIRMAIVPALVTAQQGKFVITPTIEQRYGTRLPGIEQVHTIPAWRPNPRLTPQIMKSFWLRVFFGMRASLAAEELYVETATIERYVNQAYKILRDVWSDDEYLYGIDIDALSPEDQAFVWFTLPPRQD